MEIPKRLQNREYRFVRLDRTKRAIDSDWPRTGNHSFDSDDFKNHNSNVGIVCGYGGLVVIDFDTKEAQEKYEPLLPETFTVKTGGKGLHHLYFFTSQDKKFRRGFRVHDDDDPSRNFDVQAGGPDGGASYVAIPQSVNEKTGKPYVVEKDVPIAFIDRDELDRIMEVHKKKSGSQDTIMRNYTQGIVERDKKWDEKEPGRIEIRKRMTVFQYLLKHGNVLDEKEMSEKEAEKTITREELLAIDENRPYLTMCPLGHESEARNCFYVTHEPYDVWHCFHCGKGGNVIDFVAEYEWPEEEDKYDRALEKLARLCEVELVSDKEEEEKVYTGLELVNSPIKEIPWHAYGFLSKNAIMLIAASPNTYKTSLMSHLGIDLAMGRDFLHKFDVDEPTKVLHIDLEMTKDRFALNYFNNILEAEGLMDDEKFNNLKNFIYWGTQDLAIDRDEGYEKLRKKLKDIKPDVVILDTMVNCMTGEENSATDVRLLARNLHALRVEFDLTFVILHHKRKNQPGGNNTGLETARGSSVIGGFITESWEINPIMEGFRMTQVKQRSYMENKSWDVKVDKDFKMTVLGEHEDYDRDSHVEREMGKWLSLKKVGFEFTAPECHEAIEVKTSVRRVRNALRRMRNDGRLGNGVNNKYKLLVDLSPLAFDNVEVEE